MQIQLFDQTNIDQLEWPDTEEAHQARALILPMIQEGVQAYIHNVQTQLFLMKVNDALIPITVNQKEYNNSYLTSNFFPIKYLEEHLLKKKTRFYPIQKTVVRSLGWLLKSFKINKVVIVNNWLLTTNIYPKVTEEEIKALTLFLQKKFSDHILVFRSLNTRKCTFLTLGLVSQKYRLLFSRNVFFYDPENKHQLSSKVLYHHRRDRRLIEQGGYELVRNPQILDQEIPKILNLYNQLYVSAHSKYSPQYTEKFLKLAIQKNYLNLVGIKKKGEIQGVIGFHERQETLITPFCGFDQTQKGSDHLYRILTILAINEAEERALVLNDGSGGSSPKKYRGMKPFAEYVALYDQHLPLHRRLFWGAAEQAMKFFVKSKQ